MSLHWRTIGALALALIAAPAARTAPLAPPDLVPADSLIAALVKPSPEAPPLGDPSALRTLIELGAQISGRGLGEAAHLWLRVGELVSLAMHYPHAWALLDVNAAPIAPGSGARRLDRLQAALVVELPGSGPADAAPFMQLIQKTINEQTDSGAAQLNRWDAGRWSFQSLHDQRLPHWCAISWGRIDRCFVLTIGDGAWPRIARAAAGDVRSISADSWLHLARRKRADTALIEIAVDGAAIRRRLDELVDGRVSAFFDAWGAGSWERSHWALGLDGRALFCHVHYLADGQTHERLYADPRADDAALRALAPGDARYAVYRVPAAALLRRAASGLNAVLSPGERRWLRHRWDAAVDGVDVESQVLAPLGRRVVFVNEPPHPMRIPFAVTSVLEISRDGPVVRAALDQLASRLRDALAGAADATDSQPAASAWRLEHDADGVWYVALGPFAGPAWTVTDRYVVTSWSPAALRMYLSKIGG